MLEDDERPVVAVLLFCLCEWAAKGLSELQDRTESKPRSESGLSGVPTRPSFFERRYEKSIRRFPQPLRCRTGSVIMHDTLFVGDRFSFEKYPTNLAPVVSAVVIT